MTLPLFFTSTYASIQAPKFALSTKRHFSNKRLNGYVKIEIPRFTQLPGAGKKITEKINVHLERTAAELARQASDCLSANPGRMWEYTIKYEKVVQTADYITVILTEDAICAGTPNFDKEVRVYSTADGKYITGKSLFKATFPFSEDFYADLSSELVRLDDTMVDRLLTDSSSTLKDFDAKCSDYLRFTAYRLWVDTKYAYFYPEFNQGNSGCQKEYVIRR